MEITRMQTERKWVFTNKLKNIYFKYIIASFMISFIASFITQNQIFPLDISFACLFK